MNWLFRLYHKLIPLPSGSSAAFSRGQWAEELAHNYLRTRGLRLVTRNYRCKQGEIDLIMQDGKILVFVEVRYRATQGYGDALESIDRRKQRRILACAARYLQTCKQGHVCRFDVVVIDGKTEHDNPDVLWITDAFRQQE
ncbi:MAG: YraN family protein [Gammaproteobacteria bacterium]|nr:YraN family protein [Gammaproteobacteria bacterium]